MFKKYPKIQGFKNVLKLSKKYDLGEVAYTGTIKVHGSNGSIVYDRNGIKSIRSRNRILTSEQDDNAGFWQFVTNNAVLPYLETISDKEVILYGEWCGGNIQGNMAITGLPKMFIVFSSIEVDAEGNSTPINILNFIRFNKYYENDYNTNNIYFIEQFKTFEANIDFQSTRSTQEFAELASKLTLEVEEECPVGWFFDKKGVGEGIVWKPNDLSNPYFNDIIIKTKGQKYSVTKVKTIVPLTEEQFKQQTKLEDFLKAVITDNRIEQSIQENGNDIKFMGDILRWLYNDITTEEKDLIEANNLDVKLLGKSIAKFAKTKLLKLLL